MERPHSDESAKPLTRDIDTGMLLIFRTLLTAKALSSPQDVGAHINDVSAFTFASPESIVLSIGPIPMQNSQRAEPLPSVLSSNASGHFTV
jgi:hypothetical protein